MLQRFQKGMQIRVVKPNEENTELVGKTGTVALCLILDSSAWVDMDESLPDGLATFPQSSPRRNHVLLCPEECEEISRHVIRPARRPQGHKNDVQAVADASDKQES